MITFPEFVSPLALFRPPYDSIEPCDASALREMDDVDQWKGCALVWHMIQADAEQLFAELRTRPVGMPLIVVLPPPSYIRGVSTMLPLARYLEPRMIIPYGLLESPLHLREILASPPKSIPVTLTNYLVRRGLLRTRKTIREFCRTVELAPDTRSIASLSQRLYTSRRTIGRHFSASAMPVPSHCLQFARVFFVAIHLQTGDSTIFRIASRFGYADGFTLSNQMKRLIGYRPSEVRSLLGWEWLVEAWLKREQLSRVIDDAQRIETD